MDGRCWYLFSILYFPFVFSFFSSHFPFFFFPSVLFIFSSLLPLPCLHVLSPLSLPPLPFLSPSYMYTYLISSCPTSSLFPSFLSSTLPPFFPPSVLPLVSLPCFPPLFPFLLPIQCSFLFLSLSLQHVLTYEVQEATEINSLMRANTAITRMMTNYCR